MKSRPVSEVERIRQVYRERQESLAYFGFEGPFHLERVAARYLATTRALSRSRVPIGHQTSVLDLGCGTGDALGVALSWGVHPSHTLGIDVQDELLMKARQRLGPVGFAVASGEALPIAAHTVDLVFVNTVFSSILDPDIRRVVAAEIARVLTITGAVVIYDVRQPNPSNDNLVPIGLRELRRMFPNMTLSSETLSLNTWIARRLPVVRGRVFGNQSLTMIRFLRSHRLSVVRHRDA